MFVTMKGALGPCFFARAITRCVTYLLVIFGCLWLSGCHDDDDSPSNREVNEAIYENMQENYLWYEELPAIEELDFESDPKDFFNSLLLEKDGKNGVHYSKIYKSEDSVFAPSEYLGFGMEYWPSSLQVKVVYRGGPAERAGILRGDFIRRVEGVPVTNDNIVEVLASRVDETVFTIERWNEEKGREEELDILVPGREMMYRNPVYLDTLYTGTRVGKVGYLIYSSFESGSEDQPELYNDELKQIFVRFNSAGVKHLILDFRDNPGGELDACQLLCTMLVPREAMGKVFLIEKYNDQNYDIASLFDPEDMREGAPLDIEKLIIIVNKESASASELVIHCLKPYLGDKLQVVGTKTSGKNVGMDIMDIPDSPWKIAPVTFYCLDCNGEYEYSDGLEPDVYIKDDFSGKVYSLGDRRELLLQKAMQVMGAE